MTVDIYIKERDGSREIRIPWLPEQISCKFGQSTFATYDILDTGPVAVPTGTELAEFSWESLFPGKGRNDASMQRGTWKEPKNYHNILEDWKKKGTPLRLLVTGYPINKDVLLDEYNGILSGAFGDIEYELKFIEDRDITITATKVPKKKRGDDKNANATRYTIVSGDTLWDLAQKFYGAGSKWGKIYDANKDIIESTAKKRGMSSSSHGHWIFPGVTISIPR